MLTEQEYNELPYGVGDRLELQSFLIADHLEAQGKKETLHCFDDDNLKSGIEILIELLY